MSQAGSAKSTPIPPGTFIEELQGDLGAAVGGATVNVLGNGTIAPVSLANSGIVFTGNGVSTLSATAQYLNIPNTDLSGNGALYLNTTRFLHNYTNGGSGNVFLGVGTGNLNLANFGSNNVGIGANVLTQIVNSSNVAIGANAGKFLQNSISNVIIGADAMTAAGGARNNVIIGQLAAPNLTNGNQNIIIGQTAGTNLTTNEQLNILIGSPGVLGESQVTRIGSVGNQMACYISGIDGVNVGSVAEVVTMAPGLTDQLGTATITAGAGITVTPGANLITISTTGGGVTWSTIAADQAANVNHGYFCNKAGTLALALPAVSAVGDIIEVTNENTALGVQFTQAAGQQILIGNTNTTLGAAGTLTSSAVGDTLKIVCKTASTIWRVTSGWGNWTPA